MGFKITTLIENNIDYKATDNMLLYNEHGLSIYIEVDETRILFDTGQSGNFVYNAEKLNIDVGNLDYVLLSHGHYDHGGGLKKLLEKKQQPFKLMVGNGFFDKKYSLIQEDEYEFGGNSFDEEYVESCKIPVECISSNITYISENVMIFTNFEKYNDFEKLNKKFYVNRNGEYELDDFSDEIVLAIKSKKGLFIILGCSHVGVVNILETITQRTGMNIYGIIGGTHLVDADEIRLNKTISYLKEKNIQLIGVSHCTGEYAGKELKDAFSSNFFNNNTGSVIEII